MLIAFSLQSDENVPAILLVVTFHSITKPCWRTSKNLQKYKLHEKEEGEEFVAVNAPG